MYINKLYTSWRWAPRTLGGRINHLQSRCMCLCDVL